MMDKVDGQKNLEVVSARNEAGFVLPFVLATLLIMSLIIVILTERTLNAQALARIDTSSVNLSLESQIIEQDLVWRALLEAYGVDFTLLSSGVEKRDYLAKQPETDWVRDGTPHRWSGTYEDSLVDLNPDNKFVVEIRDVRGLIDINYANVNYLRFIAEKFGVPPGQRDGAAENLVDEIRRRVDLSSLSSEDLSLPMFRGLQDVEEICALDGWKVSTICRSPDELRKIAYAGFGGMPNIMVSPKDVVTLLLDEALSDDPLQNRLTWQFIQSDLGFGDVFESIGDGYETYFVLLEHPNILPQKYILDLRIQPDERPFRIYRLR